MEKGTRALSRGAVLWVTGLVAEALSQSDLLAHRGLLGGPSLLEKYSPMSTLPISTKSRSTTDPSKYPKAGPNTAMAKRMAEKREPSQCEKGTVTSMWFLSYYTRHEWCYNVERRQTHLLSSNR